jgi:hypothetical protein
VNREQLRSYVEYEPSPRINERSLRVTVLKHWAEVLRAAANTLESEVDASLEAASRMGLYGRDRDGTPIHRGAGLLDSRINVQLSDGSLLGFSVSLDELENFTESSTGMLQILNRGLVAYRNKVNEKGEAAHALAKFEGDDIVIEIT